jgi:hypothetical protein
MKGCSFKAKYLIIAALSIMRYYKDSIAELVPLCQWGSKSGIKFYQNYKFRANSRWINLLRRNTGFPLRAIPKKEKIIYKKWES